MDTAWRALAIKRFSDFLFSLFCFARRISDNQMILSSQNYFLCKKVKKYAKIIHSAINIAPDSSYYQSIIQSFSGIGKPRGGRL